MFELVTNNVFNNIVDLGVDIVSQRNIRRMYDFSSKERSRQLSIDGGIDIKNKTIDVTLHYRSIPNKKLGY